LVSIVRAVAARAETGTAAASQGKGRFTKLGYRPALDGLRAVAIASVVGVHAFGIPASGALGVDLFFVLSGFLITTLLLEERTSNGSASLLGFYRRRALRLLPALAVFVAIYLFVALAVLPTAGDGTSSDHLGGVLVGLFYVSNLVQANGSDLPDGLVHLWSLSAEEQFYLLWPALLLASLVAFRRRVWPLVAVLAAGVAAVQALQFFLLLRSAPGIRLVYGPDTRAGSILIGCLLALVLFGRPQRPLGGRATIVAIAAFAVILFTGLGRAVFAGPVLVFGCACAALVMIALNPESRLARVLSVAPVVYLGRISYSLYLWHAPILVWFGPYNSRFEVRSVAAIVVSLAAAVASYHLVELPFRRRKQQGAAVPSARVRRFALAAQEP
jgi:peptidoglycan/LPS O-acetylase OafA/YrhL